MPDLRLAIPAAALWGTVAVVIAIPDLAAPAAAAAGLVSAGLVGWAALLRSAHGGGTRVLLARAAVVAVACALGLAAIAVQAPGRTADRLDAAGDSGSAVRLSFRVESTARSAVGGFDGEPRWRLRGTSTEDGVPVDVVVIGSAEEVRGYALGTTLGVSGKVRTAAAGDAVSYLVYADEPAELLSPAPALLAWAAPIHALFAHAAQATPGEGGDLLPGLAIGDETAVGDRLDAAMKASSLSHLTAVSGANCALVTGLAFFLAALVGLGRRARIASAAAVLAAFVVLVGPGASVLRAAVMAGVLLVALARGRPADGLPALALATVVLLVHDPWLSRDYGFALSALATAGLLLLAGPLATLLSRWMPRALAAAVAIPAAAQLACQPVLLLLSPALPLYGVLANLVTAPAAPAATVLGALACVVLPWAPALGQGLVWLAWLPSTWVAHVALRASTLPGAALPWPAGGVGVALCLIAVVAVCVVLARRRAPRLVVSTAVVALSGGGLVYTGVVAGTAVGGAVALPNDWQVAACEVGQGDALLVRSGGEVAMIDVGREPEPAVACLDRLGVSRVSVLVLTHYDADHVGGLHGVLSRVDRAFVGAPDRAADEAVLRDLAQAGVETTRAVAGMDGRLGDVSWRLVWPPDADPAPTGNSGSLVLETEGDGLRSLFLGDLGEEAQDALLATGATARVDVVKVAHHGSSDQSERLYAALGARLALVSVGADNGYGHPTARALAMLAASGSVVARTDRSGLLLVSPGQDGPRVWEERRADARAGGRPYPGYGRGGTWRPEAAAEPARARGGRPAPFRSSRGTRSGRLRSSWSPARRASSPTEPAGCCAMRSKPRTPASKSATSPPRTTRRESCSRSRAPPCSANRD